MMLLPILIANTSVTGVPLRSQIRGSLLQVFYGYRTQWDSMINAVLLVRAVTVKIEFFLSHKFVKNFGSINFITVEF